MSFRLVKGECVLDTDASTLVKHINLDTRIVDKKSLARSLFDKTYEGFFTNAYGKFIALKDISPTEVLGESVDFQSVKVKASYQAFFYKAPERGLVDILVDEVTPKRIKGYHMGYVVEIPQEDLYTGERGQYDPSSNSLLYPNQKKISLGDLLRCRVTRLVKEYETGRATRLQGSCNYPGCGKKE